MTFSDFFFNNKFRPVLQRFKKKYKTPKMNLWFVLFLFLAILAIGTLVFVLTVNSPSKAWGWWGIGAASFTLLFVFLFFASVSFTTPNANEQYIALAKLAIQDPACVSAQQQCYADKIALKRQNEEKHTGTAVEDQAAINMCAQQPSTNACIEKVIDACQNAVVAREDAILTQQFIDFRAKHEAPEVLGFCKTVTSSK